MTKPLKPVNIAHELAEIEAKVEADTTIDKAQLAFLADIIKRLIIIEAKEDQILDALSLPEVPQASSLNLTVGTPEDN